MRALTATADEAITAGIVDALTDAGIRETAYAYVCDLDRGRFGQWRSDENVYPASVIKVPIMAEAYRQYDAGVLSPDAHVVITESNQTTTDQPTPLVTGYLATARELVELMITLSDNVATNQLMDVLRRERVTDYMHELGLPTFVLGRKLSGSEPLIEDPEMTGRNRLPPAEIGRLLALIADDRIVGAAQQRAILNRCKENRKLGPGLAPGDRFMHKTGETSDLSHDAGILVTPEGRRSVIVLYTEFEPDTTANAAEASNAAMTRWMRTVRATL
ncbi:MAG: serine hydrolase [Candidatus Eremiobacter antarcticus]|nr:serine hydrolase [Candidatus Eremiobacteraeota bacterium]MBC5809136.1 serine hydrolase [Candidatus Eremiobacteraeota bacterium]